MRVMVITSFRLPPRLISRLDKEVARRRRLSPGMRIGRSDILRLALTRWLSQENNNR